MADRIMILLLAGCLAMLASACAGDSVPSNISPTALTGIPFPADRKPAALNTHLAGIETFSRSAGAVVNGDELDLPDDTDELQWAIYQFSTGERPVVVSVS